MSSRIRKFVEDIFENSTGKLSKHSPPDSAPWYGFSINQFHADHLSVFNVIFAPQHLSYAFHGPRALSFFSILWGMFDATGVNRFHTKSCKDLYDRLSSKSG